MGEVNTISRYGTNQKSVLNTQNNTNVKYNLVVSPTIKRSARQAQACYRPKSSGSNLWNKKEFSVNNKTTNKLNKNQITLNRVLPSIRPTLRTTEEHSLDKKNKPVSLPRITNNQNYKKIQNISQPHEKHSPNYHSIVRLVEGQRNKVNKIKVDRSTIDYNDLFHLDSSDNLNKTNNIGLLPLTGTKKKSLLVQKKNTYNQKMNEEVYHLNSELDSNQKSIDYHISDIKQVQIVTNTINKNCDISNKNQEIYYPMEPQSLLDQDENIMTTKITNKRTSNNSVHINGLSRKNISNSLENFWDCENQSTFDLEFENSSQYLRNNKSYSSLNQSPDIIPQNIPGRFHQYNPHVLLSRPVLKNSCYSNQSNLYKKSFKTHRSCLSSQQSRCDKSSDILEPKISLTKHNQNKRTFGRSSLFSKDNKMFSKYMKYKNIIQDKNNSETEIVNKKSVSIISDKDINSMTEFQLKFELLVKLRETYMRKNSTEESPAKLYLEYKLLESDIENCNLEELRTFFRLVNESQSTNNYFLTLESKKDQLNNEEKNSYCLNTYDSEILKKNDNIYENNSFMSLSPASKIQNISTTSSMNDKLSENYPQFYRSNSKPENLNSTNSQINQLSTLNMPLENKNSSKDLNILCMEYKTLKENPFVTSQRCQKSDIFNATENDKTNDLVQVSTNIDQCVSNIDNFTITKTNDLVQVSTNIDQCVSNIDNFTITKTNNSIKKFTEILDVNESLVASKNLSRNINEDSNSSENSPHPVIKSFIDENMKLYIKNKPLEHRQKCIPEKEPYNSLNSNGIELLPILKLQPLNSLSHSLDTYKNVNHSNLNKQIRVYHFYFNNFERSYQNIKNKKYQHIPTYRSSKLFTNINSNQLGRERYMNFAVSKDLYPFCKSPLIMSDYGFLNKSDYAYYSLIDPNCSNTDITFLMNTSNRIDQQRNILDTTNYGNTLCLDGSHQYNLNQTINPNSLNYISEITNLTCNNIEEIKDQEVNDLQNSTLNIISHQHLPTRNNTKKYNELIDNSVSIINKLPRGSINDSEIVLNYRSTINSNDILNEKLPIKLNLSNKNILAKRPDTTSGRMISDNNVNKKLSTFNSNAFRNSSYTSDTYNKLTFQNKSSKIYSGDCLENKQISLIYSSLKNALRREACRRRSREFRDSLFLSSNAFQNNTRTNRSYSESITFSQNNENINSDSKIQNPNSISRLFNLIEECNRTIDRSEYEKIALCKVDDLRKLNINLGKSSISHPNYKKQKSIDSCKLESSVLTELVLKDGENYDSTPFVENINYSHDSTKKILLKAKTGLMSGLLKSNF